MSDGDQEREFLAILSRRTGLSEEQCAAAIREQRDRDREQEEMQLARYAQLIEQRWRALSDGERLRLMAMCCRECGAIKPCEHPR